MNQILKRLLFLSLILSQPVHADLGPAEYTGPLIKDGKIVSDILNPDGNLGDQLKRGNYIYKPWCASRKVHCEVEVLDDRIVVDGIHAVVTKQFVRVWAQGMSVMDNSVFLIYRKEDGSIGRGVFVFWHVRHAQGMIARINEIWDNHLLTTDIDNLETP